MASLYRPSKRHPAARLGRRKAAVVVVLGIIAIGLLAVRIAVWPVHITLGSPQSCGGGCWDIIVTRVSHLEPLAAYQVSIGFSESSSGITSEQLAPGTLWSVQGFSLTFTDLGVPNWLDQGDQFRVWHTVTPEVCWLGLDSLRAAAGVSFAC